MHIHNQALSIALFSLRISIFLVMLMWTLDKFINPSHATHIYEKFYFIAGLGEAVMLVLGALDSLLLVVFVMGVYKKYTYGIVLAIHSVSTLSSFKQYWSPFEGSNLLFFAAWPCLRLVLLCLY